MRQAIWYQKQMATFSDAIGCVRQQIWEWQSLQTSGAEVEAGKASLACFYGKWQSLQTSGAEVEMIKIPRQYLECLTDTLCFVF
jgi:hypothetical protein